MIAVAYMQSSAAFRARRTMLSASCFFVSCFLSDSIRVKAEEACDGCWDVREIWVDVVRWEMMMQTRNGREGALARW